MSNEFVKNNFLNLEKQLSFLFKKSLGVWTVYFFNHYTKKAEENRVTET